MGIVVLLLRKREEGRKSYFLSLDRELRCKQENRRRIRPLKRGDFAFVSLVRNRRGKGEKSFFHHCGKKGNLHRGYELLAIGKV